MRSRRIVSLAVVVSLTSAAALLAACSSGSSSVSSSSGSASVGTGSDFKVPVINVAAGDKGPDGGMELDQVTWALPGDIQKIDPAVAYDFSTAPVLAQGCEGLLRFSGAGELIPNLATDWKAVDPTTYVYTIREGVTFWDGSPLTADDVAFSLNRILDPATGAYASAYYANVDAITVTGPSEVTVKLKTSDTQWKYVPAMGATGSITSKAFVEANKDTLGDPETLNMCTGPFKFDSWTKDQQIVMSRNDNYWNKERLPKVKKLVFKIIPDEATQIAALNAGEIDGGPLYTFDGRTAASLDGPLNLYSSDWAAYNALYFNTTKAPWNDARVRQAMAMALDRAGVASSVYNGQGVTIKSPIPPVMWTYEKDAYQKAYDALPAYEVDIEKAKQLVADAGATGATSTLMVDAGTNDKTALFVQQAAQQIGLDIKIFKVPFAQKTSLEYADGPKEYDMTLLTWVADTPDPLSNILLEYNSANTVTNIASYRNPDVDKYLAAAAVATTDADEASNVTAAQAQIMADVPMVPVIAPNTVVPVNSRIAGFRPSTFSYWDSWAADISGTR